MYGLVVGTLLTSNANISNVYYIDRDGINPYNRHSNNEDAIIEVFPKTETEMKNNETFINQLGEEFTKDLQNINGGYPILKSQIISLDGILITQVPTKTNYIEGQDFDLEGMIVTATYSDGTTNEVTYYTVIDGKDLKVGQNSVTISYTEKGVTKEVTQEITVTASTKRLTEITVTKEPTKTNYIEGQVFNPEGMTVTATYSDGTTNEVTNYIVIDGNVTLGQTRVLISYTENGVTKTTTQGITVAEKKLISIYISKPPSEKSYTEGQDFNPEGMIVTALYNAGKNKEVTNYTILDGNNLSIGQTSVTISYTENGVTDTTTQSIRVVEKGVEEVLTSIHVRTAPSITTYKEGQNFNPAGMIVIATYDGIGDNRVPQEEVTNYTILDGNNLSAGQTRVTISYTENGITETTTQGITVVEKVVTAIAVTKAPTNTTYIEGQNFNPEGMVITATYDDGTTKQVTNYTVLDGENLTAGKISVTISYTENGVTKTTTQTITVTEKLDIDLGTYEEQQEETGKYITKIAPETTIGEVLENIETNGTIEIYKGTEKITDTETNIGTGMTVRISFNDQEAEYTVVVKGDINGDGNAKLSDLSKLKLSVIGTTQLEGAYKEAADLNGDGSVKLSDLSKMKLYLVGTGSL